MDKLIGTGRDDSLQGSTAEDIIIGGGGNDKITGGEGGDILLGGGDGSRTVDLNRLELRYDVGAVIKVDDTASGYKNAVGMFKVAADGTISGVEILTNASVNSGKGIVNGKTEFAADLRPASRSASSSCPTPTA